MSYNINRVIISGRLTADPEVRYSAQNRAYARFRIANDKQGGNNDNDGQGTNFVRCMAFGKVAETMEQYCRKGKRVIVDGRLDVSTYERDGQKIEGTTIIVDRLEIIDWPDRQTQTTEPAPFDEEDFKF